MFGTKETNNLHKLLLTDRSVSSFCKASAINPSTNIKISKFQLSETIQLGGLCS